MAPARWLPLPCWTWLVALTLACDGAPLETDDTHETDTNDTQTELELTAVLSAVASRSLIDHGAWVRVEALDDPFASERPPSVYCDPPAWEVDPIDDHLDVFTEQCNYLMLGQPTLTEITAGELINVLVDVQPILPADAAEAHFALSIGDEVIWETRFPVPDTNHYYELLIPAPTSVPAGTPLTIHFHNHGVNSWQLYYFRVGEDPLAARDLPGR